MGCKRRNHIHQVIGVALLLILTIGCSSGGRNSPPTIPEIDESISPGHVTESNRFLWSYNLIRVDPSTHEFEVIPVRDVQAHWNVLQFLEQRPCNNCLRISGVTANPDGTLNVDVMIRHPFISLNLTGFDVRGIAMFRGSHLFPESGLVVSDRTMSDAELLNADGYTSLYNPTTIDHGLKGYIEGRLASPNIPDATLNGYKRFISDDPANTRNAFYADDEVTVTYLVHMPDSLDPWAFGYAVDASWAPPINKPVDDPMTDFGPDANCPEPWKIEVDDIGPGLKPEGGTTKLQIDVYDWQGKDDAHPVLVECPELFDDAIEAAWVSDEDGFTRYEAQIENAKLAPVGRYSCLVSKEAGENDPVGKSWLDLTAYQVCPVDVGWTPGYPIGVTPHWLNFCPRDISVQGNYAYVAGDVNGLHIFDVSDPANPVWVNQVQTAHGINQIAIMGAYAYAGSVDRDEEAYGLVIFDIDPPESACIVNTVDLPSECEELTVSGGYAYTAAGGAGLQIVDIDPPQSAYIVNTVDISGSAWSVAVSGEYAYVAAESPSGLQIIDIDPPETAHIVKEVISDDPDFHPTGVAASGGYAYVASDQMELHVIDIDPPGSAYIYKVVADAFGGEVAVSGDYAYLLNCSSTESELSIIDIADPGSAYIVDTVKIPDNAYRIAVTEDYAYTAAPSVLNIIDIEPPGSACVVSSVYTPCSAARIVFSEGMAYVSIAGFGLQIINVDTPESPYIFNRVNTGVGGGLLAISGGYACITYSGPYPGTSGFTIIDIDPPELAHVVSSAGSGWSIQGFDMSDGYAYYGTGHGSGIVDIDPPESPQYAGHLTGDPTTAIAVCNNLAFLSVMNFEENVMEIYDVDPPESAHVVKTVHTDAGRAIEVSGGYAYTADHWLHGLNFKIIDIEPLESAHLVKLVPMPDPVSFITVSDGLAYVADGNVHIIDIDPPELAHIVSSVNMAGRAHAIAVLGNHAYVACGNAGLRILKLW